IKKISSSSVIGTLVAIPLSFIVGSLIIPYAGTISEHSWLIFTLGAVFLALLAKNKILSLLIIIPFGILLQGLQHLYWGLGIIPEDTTIFVSFFLGFTIGPIVISLIELIVKNHRDSLQFLVKKEIQIKKNKKEKGFP